MPDQGSIFVENNSSVTPTPNAGTAPANVQVDPSVANLLGEIKNERGEQKYKTLEDALKALKHSQEYIPQLTNTLKQKDEELAALSGTVSKISEIEKALETLSQKAATPPTNGPSLTEDQIAELVTKTLTKTQQEAVYRANTQSVVESVKAKFGDKAQEVFYGKAQELGMSREDFNAIAAKTPKAVLKLLGIEDSTPNPVASPGSSVVNTAGIAPRSDSKIGRNTKGVIIGATTQDFKQELENVKAMVDELHSSGKTVHDLTDPKVFFKVFANKG